MITPYDHIQELRAELRNCVTRRERQLLQAELVQALAEHAKLACELDCALEAAIDEPAEGIAH